MTEKTSKRSYYLPQSLVKYFTDWCKPGRDYSPAVAGAILIWMSLPPDIREKARQAAHEPDIEKSIAAIKKDLAASFHTYNVNRWLTGLNPDQYEALFTEQYKALLTKATEPKEKKP